MGFNRGREGRQLYTTFTGRRLCIIFALLFFFSTSIFAGTVEKQRAEKVVRGWLRKNARPLGTSAGREIKNTDTFYDELSRPLYYVVYLQSGYFIIAPAEDGVEPIICIAQGKRFNPSEDNPLGALVSRDVPGRIAAARELERFSGGSQSETLVGKRASRRRAFVKARSKWGELFSYADANDSSGGALGETGISDVWVAPLLESTWGQTNVGDYIGWPTCYNYYTPSNWPCGCVAAAMAQLIRYHEYPTAGVGPPYLGGNGSGGPYVWSNMPLEPGYYITLTQRQAIGALCYDAAESIDTTYGEGSSPAYVWKTRDALPDVFHYGNAIDGWNNNNNIGVGLNGMVNPNLDAGYPVLLGLRGGTSGHAVVADGYGYNSSTLYHHLNMGWSGFDNAWYNLPDVDCSPPSYDSVDECIYNVYTSGTGEIISGRVTDLAGQPISGVDVTATGFGGPYYATTGDNGIYALVKVRSNRTYTLSAEKTSWNFSNQNVSTGNSAHDQPTSGNVWGADFTGTNSAGYIEFDEESYVSPDTVVITVIDGDLQGAGTVEVIVKTCGGDYEVLTLIEQPASSGIFSSSMAIVEGAVVTGDGVIQVQGGDIVIGIYYDSDDGTGNPATSMDTAAVNGSSGQLPVGDFEPDCDVDFDDFAILGNAWQTSLGESNYNPSCDISETADGVINVFDLSEFVESWLEIVP